MMSSVRARVTFVATTAVAVVLVIASFAIVRLVEGDLLSTAERAVLAELELEAAELEGAEFDFEDDDFERSFDIEDDDDALTLGSFVESEDGMLTGGLFSEDGRVVDLVIDPADGSLVEAFNPSTDRNIADPELLELIEGLAFEALILDDDEGGRSVLVGAAVRDEVDESLEAVRSALLVMVPTLVLLLGALIWFLVGRALRPVAAITNQVAAISTTSLDKRVPVPDGNDEISSLASVMNDMLGRLERGDQRQRQFAADASHELRSPLSTVRIAGEMLEKPVTDDRRAELSDAIVSESDRMDALIGDLLELSRIDETDSAKSFEALDLVGVVHEVCDGRVGVHVVAGAAVSVRGDRRQLTRAAANLIDNAERHAAEHVRVTIEQRDGAAVVSVEDDGAGIAEDQREAIFERFARVDASRDRSSGGTGLGLSLVRAIAHRHGGTVTAGASSDLGGARFELVLGQAL